MKSNIPEYSDISKDIVYEQHWLHARHVENERLWFTNIFVIVTGGLIALIGYMLASGASEDQPLSSLLSAFLVGIPSLILVLSVIGYFLCVSWRAPFVEHTTLVTKMLQEYPEFYKKYGTGARQDLYKLIKVGGITAHEMFLYFYGALASIALFFLLTVTLHERVNCYLYIAGGLAGMLLVSSILVWRKCLKKREEKYRKEMDVGMW